MLTLHMEADSARSPGADPENGFVDPAVTPMLDALGQKTMFVRKPNTASLPIRLPGLFGLGTPPLGRKKY
jgi:hypothetical protein